MHKPWSRAKERECELLDLASLPDDIRPPLLVCPACHETEPHTIVLGKPGKWTLICWGCKAWRVVDAPTDGDRPPA